MEDRHRFEMSHDPLTSIMNRRAFEDVLHREVIRSKRYKCKLACVMFGLDGIKQINEQYGHLSGDFVLKMVPQDSIRGFGQPTTSVAMTRISLFFCCRKPICRELKFWPTV